MDNMLNTPDGTEDIRAIRQHFRVPVEPKTGVSAILKGTPYPVTDICAEGVRIQGTEAAGFKADDVIDGCELLLPGVKVRGLTARLAHCSNGNGTGRGSGIQWVDMPDSSLKRVVDHVVRIKQALRNTIQDEPA